MTTDWVAGFASAAGRARALLPSTVLLAVAFAAVACGTPAACPQAAEECGEGVCAVLATDHRHCGACGIACAPGEVCNGAGQCALECQRGQVLCDGLCTDPMTSQDFCGATADCSGASAGEACRAGEVCAGGSCEETCQAGFVLCEDRCIDPNINRRFCGSSRTCLGMFSGVACEAGEVCSAGACAVECQPGQIICGGVCTDPQVSNTFCGASGSCEGAEAGEMCETGSICSSGQCRAACQPGQVECDGRCANPSVDNVFCGASADCAGENAGESCAPGTICSGGNCEATCLLGTIACGGVCVDSFENRFFCGAREDCAGENIGVECTSGQVCVDGACAVTCPALQVECDGRCVDARTDPAFCGASGDCEGENIGVECGPGNVCSNRACQVTCQEELVQCGNFCVDPDNDRRFCGAANECTGADAGETCLQDEVCIDGDCLAQPCPAGLLQCGAFCVEPDSDPFFCGASLDCAGANAGRRCERRQACISGVCTTVGSSDFILGLFDATSRGSFNASGARSSVANVGSLGGSRTNAYFTFSLAGVAADEVVSVYLRLTLSGYSSAQEDEAISVWDVTTSSADLARPVGLRPDIFADLEGGGRYAVRTVERTESGLVVEVDLRGSAFRDVLDAAGGDWSVGITANSLAAGTTNEFVQFAGLAQLGVEYVPTP